jgi:ADP-ribose pyrophosphatase
MGEHGSRRAIGYEVLSDERVGEGFLSLRQMRLRVVFDDGTVSKEGRWDFVERPMGRDAVVLALYARKEGRVEVLLRESLRVPLAFGRRPGPVEKGRYPGRPIVELVAGVLEEGEEDLDRIRRRAAAEAHEEAGLSVALEKVTPLGAPMWASPGIFAEQFFFVACEIDDPKGAVIPEGDGSPFEEGASLFWLPIDEAIGRSIRGEFDDVKTELGLRRLKEHLGE